MVKSDAISWWVYLSGRGLGHIFFASLKKALL